MVLNKKWLLLVLAVSLLLGGCFRYSFTGTSIPEDVNTIYIPFFPDQSNSGLGDLSDRLNQALVDRFINNTRLQLSNSQADADAVLDGVITRYTNKPSTVSGNEQTTQNRVDITVTATFRFKNADEPEFDKSFNGYAHYDPNEDPINGERNAASEALDLVARNMFNDAVSGW